MDKDLVRLAATREGGRVRRCHAFPMQGSYDVAQHSYGAVSLVLLFHPAPTLALIRAVQWHDVAERWLGDVPSPGKNAHVELKTVYERIEADYLNRLGLFGELSSDEKRWLRAVDGLELWLWAREERFLGNRNVNSWVCGIRNQLTRMDRDGELPPEISKVFRKLDRTDHRRLSDTFEDVARELSEPEAAGT